VKTLAFVWSSFGPYHLARCEAVALAVPSGIEVLGIELGPKTVTYEWVNSSENATFERIVLTEEYAERVGPLRAFTALRRALRRRRCDAIFLPSYWPAANLALLAAAKSLGLATVMMNESHQGTAQQGFFRRSVKRFLVNKFDAALVGGTKQRRYFGALGLDDRKIFLGYDAVDNRYFQNVSDDVRRTLPTWRERLGLPERYVLSLGRMVAKKNDESIIDAFAEYRRVVPAGSALVFVGSGPLERALEDRARARGLRVVDRRSATTTEHGDVYFYGFRQIDESPAFYALADAFVLASLQEEWGLVVNEAMACGTPVIVSSAAGCAEDLVIAGRTGWTFDPTSVSELAHVFQRVLADPVLLRDVGTQARKYVRTWDCANFARNALRAAEAAQPAVFVRPQTMPTAPREAVPLVGEETCSDLSPRVKSGASRERLPGERLPELLLVWSNLGPYHMGRCRGLEEAVRGKYNVIALQMGRSSTVYPWHSAETPNGVTMLNVSIGLAEDVSSWSVFRAVLRVLRERPIEAVFVPGYWPATSLAVLAAARCARRSAIMMNASHDGAASPGLLKKAVKKFLVRRFDAALVGGARHRRHFISMGMSQERVFPAYDVVDNSYYAQASATTRRRAIDERRELGLPPRYFLNLGRLVKKKNLSVLIRAFADVRRRHPNGPSLVLVGSGPERDPVIRLARKLGLNVSPQPGTDDSADLYLYPFAQVEQTPSFYALAEAFILPSKVEEWGLVVNEAMASGLPVLVSSAAGCCEDLVRHGENGFVFDPSSVDELASYMEQLILKPGLRHRMAGASARIISSWGPALFAENALAAVQASSK
jgi:glycosyltransferase involved in cell wall biosynthesis